MAFAPRLRSRVLDLQRLDGAADERGHDVGTFVAQHEVAVAFVAVVLLRADRGQPCLDEVRREELVCLLHAAGAGDAPTADAYAFLKIRDIREPSPRFSGWMFASSPALSFLDHPRYDVWVVSCNNS